MPAIICTEIEALAADPYWQRQAAARFSSVRRRQSFAAGHALLERMFTRLTALPLPEITMQPGGKPDFVSSDWHFNLSHTQGLIALILDHKPCGIDAEAVKPAPFKVLQRMGSQSELDFVLRQADKNQAFFKLWCAREALLKQSGLGLKASAKLRLDPMLRQAVFAGAEHTAFKIGKINAQGRDFILSMIPVPDDLWQLKQGHLIPLKLQEEELWQLNS